jgi:drug/metabolite transporter (DMT)-like permease
LGALVLKQRADWRLALGGLMGVTGVALMFWPEFQRTSADGMLALGLGLCVLGTLCFCSGNMLSAKNQRDGISVISANAWSMAYGALFLAVMAMVRGHEFVVETTPKYLGSLLYLTVVSTVLAFAAYLTLLGRIGAARAGYATVLFPVVALIVSTFAETLIGAGSSNYVWSVSAVAGIAMVLAGNVLVLKR